MEPLGSRHRLRRVRSILALAVALVATACSAAPVPSPSPTMPPARIIGGPNLSMMGDPFTVAVARNDEEWAFLWAAMSVDRDVGIPAPAVDLTREVVLFFGMSGSGSCPEQFEQVVISEDSHVYATWAEFDGERACTDDLRPYGVLVAVARSVLPLQFRLSLREQLSCIGCAEHPDYIDVDLST